MPINRRLSIAFAAGFLFAAGGAAAERQGTLPPATASVTDLGNGASALTYWVDRVDGRHVVTTVDVAPADGTDRHMITRVSAVLLSGQSETVSVPTADPAQPREIRISRIGDRIDVSRSIPAAQTAKVN